MLTVDRRDDQDVVTEAALLSTARALFTGDVLVPERVRASFET